MEQLLLKPDGEIHPDSFIKNNPVSGRIEMKSLSVGIAELAVIVYDALDWDLGFERQLGRDLELLIDRIISVDDEEELDEGIELCEEEISFALCEDVLSTCKSHFSTVSPR